jgi:BirA family transcriptional regulator, biotin operon repressor / biotin---[acetyl-CoA-carboxylase] ligase
VLGVDEFGVSGQLDPVRIRSALGETLAQCVDVQVEAVVDSTNARLLAMPPPPAGRLFALLAESQQAGRGRCGRAWESPHGDGLWLSLGWRYAGKVAELAALSLAVGVVVARAIEQLLDVQVRLKWPNDLLVDDGKLGGILIETTGVGADTGLVVIGVGINTRGEALPGRSVLSALTTRPVDRNALAAEVIKGLYAALPGYASHGFALFRADWLARAVWLGEQVSVSDGTYRGMLMGLDAHGHLQLQDGTGAIVTLPAGVFNLRRSG